MYCRLFFVFLLLFIVELSYANNNDWDCDKENESGWSCGDLSANDNIDNSAPSLQIETDQAIGQSNSSSKPISIKEDTISSKPPQTAVKNSGWNCFSGDTDETWNCSLKGTDPEGKAKTVEEDKRSFSLFSDAFDLKQEQNFQMLQSRLKYDPWQNCGVSTPSQYLYTQEDMNRDTVPMNVTADYTEVFDKEITSFFGNVEITRADQTVLSDRASYDAVSQTMDAQGQVYYTENEVSLFSDTALLNLQTNEARLRNALFISPSGPIRGSADVVYRDNQFLSRYKNAAFTSCRPGNQDWVLHANRLKMNKQSGKGAAKNAWLEFKGVPVLYTPYVSFPTDDRRMSGLLAPSFGRTDQSGLDITVPYYLNIAPNYDLVVRPRYMSKRGGMIGGEFRYLTEMSNGLIGIEYLPFDTLRQKPRYSGTFKNHTRFTPHLNSNIDLNYISDDAYFNELNNALGMSNNRFIQSQATLNYGGEGVSFITHFESYQTIDKDVLPSGEPYQKLPQVVLNLDHSFEDWPVNLAMENEYVNFYRNGRVSGHRFNIKPSIAFPVETAGSFIKPKFSLQHTEYLLSDQTKGKPSNITRTLPIFSVDSGLIFERDFEMADSSYLHTLEPRLFYLYIPNKNQDDIPVFDSTFYDYTFSSLFRENRFSGNDRVQDANQVTMAITSRLIDSKTGLERLKLSLGDILYFRDRDVTVVGEKIAVNDFSNVIAKLSGRITKQLSFTSGLHWDPYASKIARGYAQLTYRDLPDRIINVGYRYREEDPRYTEGDPRKVLQSISRTDASIRWPLIDSWYGVARWQYSFKYNSTTESFLGLEKDSCCWRFRILWRRYANAPSNPLDNVTNEGIYVQMELKGLTGFGDKVDKFLEQNLSGYQRPDK